MSEVLVQLTEADIRARSTTESFKRGKSYYAGGAIKRRLRHEGNLEAQIEGTQTYKVMVWTNDKGEIGARCTCPYDYGGDCKHIVATLLAWLHEPESFKPSLDLKAALNQRSKKELVELLLDILLVHPHLVEDFDIGGGPVKAGALPKKAAAIFANLSPWGHLSEAEAEAQLRLVARQADRLAEQGQTDLARQTYYALVIGCVDLCRSYGTYDFFSGSIPYDFAVVYNNLAVGQVKTKRRTIQAELGEIFRDVYDPDQLGLNEALADLCLELGIYDEG